MRLFRPGSSAAAPVTTGDVTDLLVRISAARETVDHLNQRTPSTQNGTALAALSILSSTVTRVLNPTDQNDQNTPPSAPSLR